MPNTLGPLMIDLIGPTITPEEHALLLSPEVGGVILFARQFQSKTQLKELVDALHAIRTPRLLIAVDHEGGRVQRFREGFTRIPPMRAIGELYGQDPIKANQVAYACGYIIGAELTDVGIDLNFGPVLDLDHPESQVIGDRSFNPDPMIAVTLAQSVIRGMKEAGMAAVGKHFPGHGGVREDSHEECPYDNRTFSELEHLDLSVYTEIFTTGLPAIMTAHIVFPQVTADVVTYSSLWLKQILRDKLGYQGVVFSDDLTMKAVAQGSYSQRVMRALEAGCDMMLVCNSGEMRATLLQELQQHKPLPNVTNKVAQLYAQPKQHDAHKIQEASLLIQDFVNSQTVSAMKHRA